MALSKERKHEVRTQYENWLKDSEAVLLTEYIGLSMPEMDDLRTKVREAGGEFGATTGRPRRCGWFDMVAAKHAVRINGFTELALTKLDVLDEFEEIQVCTSYKLNGGLIDDFPANSNTLFSCKPVYKSIGGWQSPTDHCRKYEELPEKARLYIEYLEDTVQVPVKYISVGVDRRQIIFR